MKDRDNNLVSDAFDKPNVFPVSPHLVFTKPGKTAAKTLAIGLVLMFSGFGSFALCPLGICDPGVLGLALQFMMGSVGSILVLIVLICGIKVYRSSYSVQVAKLVTGFINEFAQTKDRKLFLARIENLKLQAAAEPSEALSKRSASDQRDALNKAVQDMQFFLDQRDAQTDSGAFRT